MSWSGRSCTSTKEDFPSTSHRKCCFGARSTVTRASVFENEWNAFWTHWSKQIFIVYENKQFPGWLYRFFGYEAPTVAQQIQSSLFNGYSKRTKINDKNGSICIRLKHLDPKGLVLPQHCLSLSTGCQRYIFRVNKALVILIVSFYVILIFSYPTVRLRRILLSTGRYSYTLHTAVSHVLWCCVSPPIQWFCFRKYIGVITSKNIYFYYKNEYLLVEIICLYFHFITNTPLQPRQMSSAKLFSKLNKTFFWILWSCIYLFLIKTNNVWGYPTDTSAKKKPYWMSSCHINWLEAVISHLLLSMCEIIG